jgi:purine nucleoside phosphorylase
MITNLGAGMTGRPLSHDETKAVAAEGSERMRLMVTRLVARIGAGA